MLAIGNSQLWILRNVGNPVEIADLAIEEVAHEERWRQSLTAQVFECFDGLRNQHDYPPIF